MLTTESQILSEITSHLKYAKYLPEKNRRETWEELVTRNKNMHIEKFPLLKEEIEQAYQFVYDKKVLPSMRSLQFGGKPIDINNARIFNCSYLPIDDYRAFSEIMFLLLSGCGVGYSVQTHHVDNLPEITTPVKHKRYLVGDSIEGWADAIRMLCKAYFTGGSLPIFDFRDIRPKGAQLITVGGKAPGPEPLKECLFNLQKILDRKKTGDKLTSLEAHDMACHIADAVLSGGCGRRDLPRLAGAPGDPGRSAHRHGQDGCRGGNDLPSPRGGALAVPESPAGDQLSDRREHWETHWGRARLGNGPAQGGADRPRHLRSFAGAGVECADDGVSDAGLRPRAL